MIAVLAEPGMIRVGALLTLDPAESRHLEVRRAESGDRVRLLDGRGCVGIGTVSLGRKEARVEVQEATRVAPPPSLVLGVGAGDRERFGWLVEKCAELGVTELVPITTSRAANVANRIRAEHVEKLARRALEAIKQSGNPHAPVVGAPESLAAFLGRSAGIRLVAEQGGGALPALGGTDTVLAAVGPEGGWTDEEAGLFRGAEFIPIGLGAHTLRFETAAIASVIAVNLARKGS